MEVRERTIVALALVLGLITLAGASSAVTIRVPLDQPTIQEGMDAASEGDTVLVAPDTYAGEGNVDLDPGGTNMVIMSEAGAAQTIIDGGGTDHAFHLWQGEGAACVISGFTITNGHGGNGGGMKIGDSAATIEDCVFSNNVATMNGGGLHYGYAPEAGVIRNCVFYGNSAPYRGGGINVDSCYPPDYVPPLIENCVFYNNEAATGGSHGGGGVYCNSAAATITGCTFVGNAASDGAGGIHGYFNTPIVTNTIVAFSTEGEGVYGCNVDQSVIFGNAGGPGPELSRDFLEVDPLFCDMEGWDLTLCSDSPCLPGAPENTWGVLIGALGSGCGDCDTVVEEGTWGSIKAMYRNP